MSTHIHGCNLPISVDPPQSSVRQDDYRKNASPANTSSENEVAIRKSANDDYVDVLGYGKYVDTCGVPKSPASVG